MYDESSNSRNPIGRYVRRRGQCPYGEGGEGGGIEIAAARVHVDYGLRSERALLSGESPCRRGYGVPLGASVFIHGGVPRSGEQSVRAAYLMMPVVAVYALVPLAMATLITGVALSVGTKWGLLQHYWVVASLVITLLAAAILVLHLPAVEDLAVLAADPQEDVTTLGGDVFPSLGGLLVLSVPLVLNVVKPRGLTRRGWRAQHKQRASS